MKRLTGLLVVVLVGCAVLVVGPPTVQAQGNRYAAIAYSESTGAYGYSDNYGSRYSAEQAALNNCNAGDARVVVWVRNGWCALALGDNVGSHGFGWSNSSSVAARNTALSQCRQYTTGCYIAVSVYSGN